MITMIDFCDLIEYYLIVNYTSILKFLDMKNVYFKHSIKKYGAL